MGDSARLLMFDTERVSIDGVTETSFHLPYSKDSSWFLSSEPCGHVPSPDELITSPFYSDPYQRILGLGLGRGGACYVINTVLLLGLARSWVNQDVGWDRWGTHTTEVLVGNCVRMWITGCRLFCITPGDQHNRDSAFLQVFDLSHRGRTKNLSGPSENGATRRVSRSSAKRKLPWGSLCICAVTVGHDSILFCLVSFYNFVLTNS